MAEPKGIVRGVDLGRYLTVRCGGPAELFARPQTAAELVELLAWAGEQGLAVHVLGSGSNVLVPDRGLEGLVLKLGSAFAGVSIEGEEVEAGGAVRLPALAAQTARAGLAGLEFGVSIPGTVGGAVRMNAGAYGGELAGVLVWVELATAQGLSRQAAAQLGLSYRRSALRPGVEVVTRARLALRRDDPQAVRERLAKLRRDRRGAQPAGIKTFGSTFKNPPEGPTAGQLLDACGAAGLQLGRARFSPKHANFIENLGGATTTEILELMAKGRELVEKRFGVALEPEVQLLGGERFPWER